MITADGFGLGGPRGRVFGGVSFTAGVGELVALEGPPGSGRTSLLLALTGRMRATEGRAEAGGYPLPRRMAAVRRISALGPIATVAELEPALTVGEHLRERGLLLRGFGSRAAARGRAVEALAAAGLDLDALAAGPRTAVRDLDRPAELRLGVALALMARPRLLGVDDVDLGLGAADRADVWAVLRAVAATGPTVLAVCAQAPDQVPVTVRLPAPGAPTAWDDRPAAPHSPAAGPEGADPREAEPEPADPGAAGPRQPDARDPDGGRPATRQSDSEHPGGPDPGSPDRHLQEPTDPDPDGPDPDGPDRHVQEPDDPEPGARDCTGPRPAPQEGAADAHAEARRV